MRCNNDVLMNKITNNKLDKNVELFLTVLNNLPDCKKVRADKYVKIVDGEGAEVETVPQFNKFKVPDNMFECDREGCINSGTLYPQNAEGNVIYRLPYDAVEFAGGLVTFYVTGFEGAKNVTVKISDKDDFANADVYTQSATGNGDGFVPVIIDLSEAPSSATGDGWTATRNGAYISINVADANAGISSINVYDSKDDFKTSDVVVIGCLSEIGGDEEFEEAEATCWSSGFDTSADNTKEVKVTGNSITPNYHKLNPRYGRGTATTGYASTNIEATIEADGDYGVVTLPDMSQDACGFLGVQLADACDVTGSQLERLTIPTQIALDEDQFNAIQNEDGSTTLYFNKNLVGNPVKVTYPQIQSDVTERVYSDENLGNVRVRAEQVITQSDGVKIVRVFDHVLVTSFPGTINEDETEFSFTLSIQRGANGHRYREYVIGQ